MKTYYLMTEKGLTGRFFCGNIYEALATEKIKIDGESVSFEFATEIGTCKSFSTLKEAEKYSWYEQRMKLEANDYAKDAMNCEAYYGVEGVDDMRWEN